MAVLIGGLLAVGVVIAGVRVTRTDTTAQPTVSPTAAFTTGEPSPTESPTDLPSPTPSETVLPGDTESPTPSETALPKTGDDAGGLIPIVALTLVIALAGGVVLGRAH